jgi:hypothetical protein
MDSTGLFTNEYEPHDHQFRGGITQMPMRQDVDGALTSEVKASRFLDGPYSSTAFVQIDGGRIVQVCDGG